MRVLVVIVAVLALAAVAFYAVQKLPANIEADLKQRATEALATAKLPFANVSVTGRVVTLSGEAPNPAAKEQAVKVAGDVWGVQSVTDTLSVSSAAQPSSPQTAVVASADPSPAPATPAPAVEPAAQPPQEQSSPAPEASTTTGPSVAGLVDPALAPPADTETPEPSADAPHAAAEPATPEPSPSPAPSAEQTPAPAPATQEPQVAAVAPPPTAPPVTVGTPTALPPPAATATPPAQPVAPPPAPVQPDPAIAKGVATALTAPVQPATAAAPPEFRLEAQVEGRRVEIQGVVSSPWAKRMLAGQVRRYMRNAQIVDTTQISAAKGDKNWLSAASTGVSQLARLETGSLKLDSRNLSLSGKPKRDSDRKRIMTALNNLPAGFTSNVLLEQPPEAPAPTPAVVAEAPAAAPPPPVAAPPPTVEPKPAYVEPKPAYVAPRRTARRYRTPPRRTYVERVSLSSECRRRFGDVLPRVAVVFESGSSRVRSDGVAGLNEFAQIARRCPGARIRLTGHTDTREAPTDAERLSRMRALAVREALEERGVSGASISVVGRGGTRPAFSNATADGRDNNRRVEFAVW